MAVGGISVASVVDGGDGVSRGLVMGAGAGGGATGGLTVLALTLLPVAVLGDGDSSVGLGQWK